jgi:hypothetical protein
VAPTVTPRLDDDRLDFAFAARGTDRARFNVIPGPERGANRKTGRLKSARPISVAIKQAVALSGSQ